MLGIDLAGGAVVFFIFTVAFLVAVTYGLYSRTGSGIGQHPYGDVHGGAPGARGESRMSGSADRDVIGWTHGTH
jgi:hypothetical protein